MPTRQAVAALRERFRGQVVLPGDPGYDRARAVWNATADGRPAAVARGAGVEDVVAAVRFAASRSCWSPSAAAATAIPGSRPATAASSSTCRRWAGSGSTPSGGWPRPPGRPAGELDRRAQTFGPACPTGHVSHTGVGGLTLGGGVGRLTRRHGLTLDNLLAVELVTADGERLRVDAATEPELFWGPRGAGPTSGWRPPSSWPCTRSGRWSWPASPSTPWTPSPPAVPGPPGRERRPLPLGPAPLLEGPAAGGPGRRRRGPDRGAAGRRPGPDCGVGLLSLGGAFGRVPEDATAFSGRSAALRPFATSVNYVNDLGQLDQDAVRSAHGPAKYDRLVALKRTWDPANVFRRNQNIRP